MDACLDGTLTGPGDSAGGGGVAGENPAARSSSSVSSSVSRRISAQRTMSSRYRGREVTPSFQRRSVGRLTGMRRASSASPMPVRSM